MALRFLSFPAAILLFGTCVFAQTNTSGPFTENLSLGSTGTQVIALQKILNQSADTRIAESGPGSPGKETDYFGPLTAAAVGRFQEKYANDILLPAGLTHGTSYVGPLTRAKLNLLSQAARANVDTFPAPVSAAPLPKTTAPTIKTNPNLQNIDLVLSYVDKIEAAHSVSSSTTQAINKIIVERLSTTTDLKAEFFKKIRAEEARANDSSPLNALVTAIERFFFPQRALASTGLPFGGALLGVIPCDVGFNLVIEPLPPTYVTLLYYVQGTEAFLYHNIPDTSELLGTYISGGGACFEGPYYVWSEGTITPETGSSLI